MVQESDERYMRIALEMAETCRGQTSPNPMVGAVIVKNGEIIGVGAHLKAGSPHAERHALHLAGEKAIGSTVYVTLEPCCHTGRTPPCADALIEARVKRVVIGATDPNPLVAGNGIKRLKDAGIEVVAGVLGEEAMRLNEVFNKYIVTGLPFVTVKTASTLDGKTATVTGSSRWITGESARREVHRLRSEHDAILVGVNTVIEDDPQLTVRLPEGGKNPLRVILDSRLRIPLSARVIVDNHAPTWIFTTDFAEQEKKHQLENMGIKVISSGTQEFVDIPFVLKTLGGHGYSSVLVEGGSRVNGSFLQTDCIDKVISYIAPKLVGGIDAPTPFAGEGVRIMDESIVLENMEVVMVGEDIRITGYPRKKEGRPCSQE